MPERPGWLAWASRSVALPRPVGAPVVWPPLRGTGAHREVPQKLMRPYEVMVILDTGLEEDAIQAVVDRATGLITSGGGTVSKVDHWGRRRLAYEIGHRSEGYYVLIEAMAEPTAVEEIDRMLSLADEVMRHKVVRIPEAVAAKARQRSASDPVPAASGGRA